MNMIRIAIFAVALSPLGALAALGPEAEELLALNKKMAEPTCQRTRMVLEMATATNEGKKERTEVLKGEIRKIDEDPKIIALTQRGKELARHRFNAEEQRVFQQQMASIQNACPWLKPTAKK
jgi:hypothetical protein